MKRQTSPYMVGGSKGELSSLKDQSPIKRNIPPETFTTLQKHFTGKLLLKEELYLDVATFHYLLEKNYFVKYPAIYKEKNNFICRRCHQTKRHYFEELPCHRCQKTHVYCRNCIVMGRVLQCASLYEWVKSPFEWPIHIDALQWKGTLSQAQQKAAYKIKRGVDRHTTHLIWAVTGSGKTEMLFPAIQYALRLGKRICIASPRVDVVKELLLRIAKAFPNVTLEGLYNNSEYKNQSGQIVIATTHQLLRFKEAFDFMVVDEVDAFPYHLDESLQFAVSRARKKQSTIVYLTATPRKEFLRQAKKKRIDIIFVPIRYHQYPLIVPTTMYVYRLQHMIDNNQGIKRLEAWIRNRKKPSRQLLIFMPSVKQVTLYRKALVTFFKNEKIIKNESELQAVHATDVDRNDKVMHFRNKQIKVLLTTTILERGVTFPSVDVIVLRADHTIFDEAALVQIAGRAGRSKADPSGHVLYVHEGLTNDILAAKEMITMMNNKRKKFLRLRED